MTLKNSKILSVSKQDLDDAIMILAGQYERHVTTDASDNKYICYNKKPGTALSDASWQVLRIDTDGNGQFAGETRNFIHPATDPASLSYPSRT